MDLSYKLNEPMIAMKWTYNKDKMRAKQNCMSYLGLKGKVSDHGH